MPVTGEASVWFFLDSSIETVVVISYDLAGFTFVSESSIDLLDLFSVFFCGFSSYSSSSFFDFLKKRKYLANLFLNLH